MLKGDAIMDKRKKDILDNIKATASPARVFVIIGAIFLLAAGTLSMICAFYVQSKGIPSGHRFVLLAVEGDSKEQVVGWAVTTALLSWLEANVLLEIGRMLRRIAQDGLPFKPLGRSFRICGVLLMIAMFVPDLIGSVVTGILCRINEQAIGWSLGFDLRLDLLIIAFIVLVLSRIFEYGALLQQESDETL